MKVCLISAPTANDFDDPNIVESEGARVTSEEAPLGILSLAAVLELDGAAPRLIDLNRLYRAWLRSEERKSGVTFARHAAESIAGGNDDLFGFSTICSSYPLTLRIAGELKQIQSHATIILGGPQASVVDVETLQSFPAIDLIVRGEAEETLPALLDAITHDQTPRGIAGVTYRTNGTIERNPDAAPIADLDALPMPAYHLYQYGFPRSNVPLEVGRGCPYACTFCSTNHFFRRRYRLKSPARLLSEMRQLRDSYNATSFDLSHDSFTVDRKKVVAFCETLLESGEEFVWSCSARTDCVDEGLLSLMAKAGCRGVFFGVESGSARMQKIIRKNLDLAKAAEHVGVCDRLEIATAVSLIIGFPEETIDDLRDTVGTFVDSLRFDYAEPQLGILAPLAATPIHDLHKDRLVFDNVIPDMSFQGWRQDAEDTAMIRRHPAVFPNFYGVETPFLDRHFLKELREFLLNGTVAFRWLLVGLHQDAGNLADVFSAWRQWRKAHRTPLPDDDVVMYYGRRRFRNDFLEFVRTDYIPHQCRARTAIGTLLEYEASLDFEDEGGCPDANSAGPCDDQSQALSLESSPRVARGVQVTSLDVDYQAIIRRLRAKRPIHRVPRRNVTVITGNVPNQSRSRILQLSPLSARLLTFCDGRPVRDVAKQFAKEPLAPAGVTPDLACLYGFELLRRQGLVELARPSFH